MKNPPPHVPEALMQQLHQATERFHICRKQLEEAMSESEYQHQEHIDLATENLRAAESEVEVAEAQIKQTLSSPSA